MSHRALVVSLLLYRFGNPMSAWYIGRAIDGAAERLAVPACARVFDDFADSAGRPLSAVLAGTGLTAAGFLRTLYFIDAGDMPACTGNDRLSAYTVPGTKAIFVCADRFERHNRDRPRAGEMLVIHEMLHALGLGENPPSSGAIAAKVKDRCLSAPAVPRPPSGRDES